MTPRWAELDERERTAFQVMFAFLKSRLQEQQSIDWALNLPQGAWVKRLAVLEVVDREARHMAEPWRSAWRLVEEFWSASAVADSGEAGAYRAKKRLQQGDRSGALIDTIVALVAPRIELHGFSGSHTQPTRPAKRPRSVHDLFSIRLTSGTYLDPHALGIDALNEGTFLSSLAHALDVAVLRGLDSARRIGWDGDGFPWQLGSLHRVYHVAAGGVADPDKYHRGIAPSVKLLHEVVARLFALNAPLACEFSQRWKVTPTPVHERLWCALARNPRIASADEVAQVLLAADDRRFWNYIHFPEFAELRARRFAELDARHQASLMTRLRKLPPRRQWPKAQSAEQVAHARIARAIVEVRRIEIGGGTLAPHDRTWLDSHAAQFPALLQMTRIDEGFALGTQVRWGAPSPDHSYDALVGEARLKALEVALSTARRRWDDNPAERATDWLREGEGGNAIQLIADLESVSDAGATFPSVWESFAWSHTPPRTQVEGPARRDLPGEAARVFALLSRLPTDTTRHAIEGMTNWLIVWDEHLTTPSPEARRDLWMKFWPLAVVATNARAGEEEALRTNAVAAASAATSSNIEMDTLNTPAGKLAGVFLRACPEVHRDDRPFVASNALREMRDALLTATGRSRLIVLHRLIEELPYFLQADQAWAQTHLIAALNADDADALALWHAIARATRFHDVLTVIGDSMARRVVDPKLSRDTRQALTFSLVVECLHALTDGRQPAVPYSRVQQMLRSVEDEVRAHAADVIQKFVEEISGAPDQNAGRPTPEDLFRTAAAPFLRDVWPQERSLATPGVARALADLPATAAGVFAEAVETIDRFLVPFECWSMFEYGLDSDGESRSPLLKIDDAEKATALLRLLDRTIGTAEGSVIPTDLSDALKQVRTVVPRLVDDRLYRRLAAAARRT